MSSSPNSSLVKRKIEQTYEKQKRSSSLRWIAVNGVLFAVFAYDLCCTCSEFTTVLHYVQLCLTAILAGNMLQHALRLASCLRRHSNTGGIPLDTSSAVPLYSDLQASWPAYLLARPWRRDQASPSPPRSPPRAPLSPPRVPARSSPPSPPSPSSPHTPLPGRSDKFIADRRALTDYLRQWELVPEPSLARWGWSAGPALPVGEVPPAPHHHIYQLSSIENEGADSSPEGGREEGGRGARSPPQVLRRLQLDPQQLTQFHLNLRLWIHVTILERLVKEMDRLDALLGGAGAEARVGAASLERLAAAAAGVAGAPALLVALQPFLEPFADQRYFAGRVRELARGGCLSGFRWDGGGAEWEDSRPTDAELVLQVVASYLDVQLPGGGVLGGEVRRPFSSAHMSAGPGPAPRGPRVVALHRAGRRPPHYVVALREETLEVGRGRDNALAALLVLVAALAREEPPALQRVHLGPAGLNLLWVIGR